MDVLGCETCNVEPDADSHEKIFHIQASRSDAVGDSNAYSECVSWELHRWLLDEDKTHIVFWNF